MRGRFTSLSVGGALAGLSAILLVSRPGLVAATHPGGGSKTETPAKAPVKPEKTQPEPQATRNTGSGPESKLSNPKMAATDALMRTLDHEISTKDLPRSFWSLLEYLTAKVAEAGKELPFYVDVSAFSKDVRAVIDGELPPPLFKLRPSLPPRLPVRAILQMALNEFDGGQGTFLIRQHRVEITSTKAASLPNLLKQTFAASFDRQPFEFVLDDLSEITGVSVVIDGRARDRLRTPVTARFRNDVPLLEALRMVTESAGLKLVQLPAGPGPACALFVTTPEHAQSLRR
ncbi:MAG: DUF4974 domain-containing protein [Gemmataceae bacterium]|nr:DUF4974 domain-containing protein [Gemmataceae bacterium]